MNEIGATVLTIVLSAIVGYFAAILVEKSKLKHRLRLENEYQILMKLWEKAYWVKSRANNLRPEHGVPASSEVEKQERLTVFAKAMEEFREEMYLRKPFYPKVIHELLGKIKLETHMEAFDYSQTSPDRHAEYWDKASENTKKIDVLVDQLCNAIRYHIHNG